MGDILKVRCPTCHRVGEWFAGAYGPFCSKRCRLIDLGKWFNEEHAISDPLRPEHLEPYADLPPGQDLDATDTEEQDRRSPPPSARPASGDPDQDPTSA